MHSHRSHEGGCHRLGFIKRAASECHFNAVDVVGTAINDENAHSIGQHQRLIDVEAHGAEGVYVGLS